jgi:hypothetical protein
LLMSSMCSRSISSTYTDINRGIVTLVDIIVCL